MASGRHPIWWMYGLTAQRRADGPAQRKSGEYRDEQDPGTDRKDERAGVFPHGRSILLDAIQAVQRALDLTQQGRSRDQRSGQTDDQGKVTVRRTSLVGLLNGVRQDGSGGPWDDLLERLDDDDAQPPDPNALARPTRAIMPSMKTRVVRYAIDRAWLKPSA